MAHDWGVPALAGSFGLEHAEPLSWQLGRDSVYSALFCALAGADLSIGLGLLKASTLLVPEQILFDDEIYHTHRLLAHGLDISPGGIARDVIEAVGPGGHFLSQKHTREKMREIWIPELTHPRISPEGEIDADIQRRAKAKLEEIILEHEPPPLEESVKSEINKILLKAEEQIGK
jgi:trimethylamine--corrinoid protein Co-methyltransferase